jgi:anhydro-N-acetylmuramic acid kinase
MKLMIGLMSGTSMDGMDAALVDVDNNTLLMGLTRSYSDKAKRSLHAIVNEPQTTARELSQLNTLLGREFSSAVHQLLAVTGTSSKDVVAIGSHGQTICHDATAEIPYTLQLGCAHTIAELTGITVVADFRTRDLVLGGHGAPFAPIYHQAVFAQQDRPIAIVNIGGIANITFLSQHRDLSGYDIGPGNCLMDAWIQKHVGLAFDAGGEWAATGSVHMPLLEAMLSDPSFSRAPPKSLGKEYFSLDWLSRYLPATIAEEDVQATLMVLTSKSISEAIKKYEEPVNHLAICGGGVHNTHLFHSIEKNLPGIEVVSTQQWGIDPDYMEAMMFAWLANKTILQHPVNMQPITGAKKSAILGVIYSAGIDNRNSIEV